MTMIPLLLFAIPFVTLLFFPISESVEDPIRIYLLVFVPSTTILAYFACAGSISYYVAMIYAGDVDERIPSIIESIKRGIIKLGTIILFLFLFKIGCVVGLITFAAFAAVFYSFIGILFGDDASYIMINILLITVLILVLIPYLCISYMMMMVSVPIIIIEDKSAIEAMKRVVYLIRELSLTTVIGTFLFHRFIMSMVWGFVAICTTSINEYIAGIICTLIFAISEPVFFSVLYMLLRIGGDENLNETDFSQSFSNRHHPNFTSIDNKHDDDQYYVIPMVVLSEINVVTDSMSTFV